MIQRARDWLNRKAVPVLFVVSLILAVVSFSSGYKMGGTEWERNYIAMKQACSEEIVTTHIEYQAKLFIMKKAIEKFLGRGRRSVPIIPKPEYTRLFI